MDRLDELTVFLAIIDAGSLAAAGRRLRKSPPTVTRILAALEDRAGARLVERTTRKLVPTEAGRRLVEQAGRVLAAYDEALREPSAAQVRGVLRVTAPSVFGRRHVTPIVASFLDAWPAVRVELVLSDKSLDLFDERLDVAVRIGRLGDSSLVVRRVGEVRRMLVASPAYLARRGRPESPADLAGHDLIFTSGSSAPLEWRFGPGLRGQAVALSPRLVVNDTDATLLAVRAGRGIGRALSYQVADDLAAQTLQRLLPEWEPPPLPVQLVVPSARQLPQKTRAFLDHAARALSVLGVIR